MKLSAFQQAVADISKTFGKDMAEIVKLPEAKQEKANDNRLKKQSRVTKLPVHTQARVNPFEKNLQTVLLANHLKVSGYEFVLPNFRYQGSTMDLFCVAPKDRVMEIAILTTQEEYEAEWKKMYRLGKVGVNKHAQLKAGKGLPNFFWIVVCQYSDFELDLKKFPSHCGLIYSEIPFGRVLPVFSILRAAPMLHNNFMPASTYKHIAQHLERRNEALNAKYGHGQFKIFNPDRNDDQQTELFEP